MCTVRYKSGDLAKDPTLVKVHQVNCQGVMGSGVAKSIRAEYPKVYKAYKRLCETKDTSELLGNAQFVDVGFNTVVVNLFGQLNYGRNGLYTDYKALKRALKEIKYVLTYVSDYIFYDEMAFPYMIGCGLGGGNWNIVQSLILNEFQDWSGEIIFVKYDK